MKREDIQEIAARIHRGYPKLSLFQCAALATDIYGWLREIERERGDGESSHWFYTDPLAAAWMAKHFGMRFTGQQAYVECTAGSDGYQEWSGMDTTVLSFIHPDSLHLLEPMVGDKSSDGLVWNGKRWQCQWALLEADQSHTAWRNGVAFHRPERE